MRKSGMKPVIAITMGDMNGIGPEIVLKSLRATAIRQSCIPLLVGSIDVFDYYAQRIGMRLQLQEVSAIPSRFVPERYPVLHIRRFQTPAIRPGTVSREAGGYAGEAVTIAAELCQRGAVEAMVTAPISKEALQLARYRFPGQTEMLAQICGTSRVAMMLVADTLRIGLATIHIPLRRVASSLTKQLLTEKLAILAHSLRRDFGIRIPRIAILGVNPHAGENGTIGMEEELVVHPTIRWAVRRGMRAEGPFPADGFFGCHAYRQYDGVLAMYHDQGSVPLKMKGFDIGVNFSAGLPIVRTSPDHGTAFDIAGRNAASPSSMIEAVKLAATIVHNRRRSSR